MMLFSSCFKLFLFEFSWNTSFFVYKPFSAYNNMLTNCVVACLTTPMFQFKTDNTHEWFFIASHIHLHPLFSCANSHLLFVEMTCYESIPQALHRLTNGWHVIFRFFLVSAEEYYDNPSYHPTRCYFELVSRRKREQHFYTYATWQLCALLRLFITRPSHKSDKSVSRARTPSRVHMYAIG